MLYSPLSLIVNSLDKAVEYIVFRIKYLKYNDNIEMPVVVIFEMKFFLIFLVLAKNFLH